MIPTNGSSFGRAGGRLRRYPGGTENERIIRNAMEFRRLARHPLREGNNANLTQKRFRARPVGAISMGH